VADYYFVSGASTETSSKPKKGSSKNSASNLQLAFHQGVRAVAKIFGRGSKGSGRTHERIRAAEPATELAIRIAARQGRQLTKIAAPVYQRPTAVYATQPTIGPPVVPQIDPVTVGLLNFYLQYKTANDDALAAAHQSALYETAPWWAQPDVVGPPGPYETGQFYGVNNPLLVGSRQDPRGLRRPPNVRWRFSA